MSKNPSFLLRQRASRSSLVHGSLIKDGSPMLAHLARKHALGQRLSSTSASSRTAAGSLGRLSNLPTAILSPPRTSISRDHLHKLCRMSALLPPLPDSTEESELLDGLQTLISLMDVVKEVDLNLKVDVGGDHKQAVRRKLLDSLWQHEKVQINAESVSDQEKESSVENDTVSGKELLEWAHNGPIRPGRSGAIMRTTPDPPSSEPRDTPSSAAAPDAQPPTSEPLERSIPTTNGLFLISLPIPPSNWPSDIALLSPLITSVERIMKRNKMRVLVVWDGVGQKKFDKDAQEVYHAKIYLKDGTRVELRNLDMLVIKSSEFTSFFKQVKEVDDIGSIQVPPNGLFQKIETNHKEILVCTHGSRDCRCSDQGLPLVEALEREIDSKGLDVKVLQCSHVGGHKFAANAITLPSRHLLGNLRHTYASSILGFTNDPKGSTIWANYRGSFGMDKEEQMRLFESNDPEEKQGYLDIKGKKVALKDNFMLRDTTTTCSSRMLQDFKAPYTATSVSLLQQAGIDLLPQKTAMDEFGMGSSTTNLPPGSSPVLNPFRLTSNANGDKQSRSAGGSSGGSAVSVASGSSWAALGTDTGGSVRLPASYCGLVGMKPSYGMISRHGVVAYADSLDCVGILTQNVSDAMQLYGIISQPDEMDATCITHTMRERLSENTRNALESLGGLGDGDLKGLRIAIPIETTLEPSLTPFDLSSLLDRFKQAGAEISTVSLPSITHSLPAYYVLACAEASSNLARYGGGWYGGSFADEMVGQPVMTRQELRTKGFGKEVRNRILAGTHALTADAFSNSYLKAMHLRRQLQLDYDSVFRHANLCASSRSSSAKSRTASELNANGVDILLHLTSIRTAPTLTLQPNETYAETDQTTSTYAQDILTVPASLAGLPCLSMPWGKGSDGWPVGVSLTGQWGMDEVVMKLAGGMDKVVSARA